MLNTKRHQTPEAFYTSISLKLLSAKYSAEVAAMWGPIFAALDNKHRACFFGIFSRLLQLRGEMVDNRDLQQLVWSLINGFSLERDSEVTACMVGCLLQLARAVGRERFGQYVVPAIFDVLAKFAFVPSPRLALYFVTATNHFYSMINPYHLEKLFIQLVTQLCDHETHVLVRFETARFLDRCLSNSMQHPTNCTFLAVNKLVALLHQQMPDPAKEVQKMFKKVLVHALRIQTDLTRKIMNDLLKQP